MHERSAAFAPRHLPGPLAVACDAADADRDAVGRNDLHDVVLLEFALDTTNAHRKQARRLGAQQSLVRPLVDMQFSLGETLAMSDPLLPSA